MARCRQNILASIERYLRRLCKLGNDPLKNPNCLQKSFRAFMKLRQNTDKNCTLK